MRRALVVLVVVGAGCSAGPEEPAGTVTAVPAVTVPVDEVDPEQIAGAAFVFCLDGMSDSAARTAMRDDGSYNVDEVELVLANLATLRRAGQCD